MSNPVGGPVHPIWNVPPAWPNSGSSPGTLVVPIPRVSKVLALGIVLAIAAPWLVHLVPVSGAPLGPILLPMFYAPMQAALMLRLPVAVAVSVGAPILSQYLTGMPPQAILPVLMPDPVFRDRGSSTESPALGWGWRPSRTSSAS